MRRAALPAGARIVAPLDRLDYLDVQRAELPWSVTALEAWHRMKSQRSPLFAFAMRLRDIVAGWFGVAPIGGLSATTEVDPQPGDRMDFFTVDHIDPAVLALVVRDRHLDTMTCVSVEGRTVFVTASVVTHNLFGRIYMLPVGPAHRLIVRHFLRGMVRAMATERPAGTAP